MHVCMLCCQAKARRTLLFLSHIVGDFDVRGQLSDLPYGFN
jgi:hypothetical protein